MNTKYDSMELSSDQDDLFLTSLLEKCRETASELSSDSKQEVSGSFILMNAKRRLAGCKSIASEMYRHIAVMKAAVVVQEKTDVHLKDPHEDFRSLGPVYVACGCLVCDFNMLCGSMCCTERLNLMGAVPIRQLDGEIGALSVATSAHAYSKEKEIATRSLRQLNFKDIDGVWTHQSICLQKTETITANERK